MTKPDKLKLTLLLDRFDHHPDGSTKGDVHPDGTVRAPYPDLHSTIFSAKNEDMEVTSARGELKGALFVFVDRPGEKRRTYAIGPYEFMDALWPKIVEDLEPEKPDYWLPSSTGKVHSVLFLSKHSNLAITRCGIHLEPEPLRTEKPRPEDACSRCWKSHKEVQKERD